MSVPFDAWAGRRAAAGDFRGAIKALILTVVTVAYSWTCSTRPQVLSCRIATIKVLPFCLGGSSCWASSQVCGAWRGALIIKQLSRELENTKFLLWQDSRVRAISDLFVGSTNNHFHIIFYISIVFSVFPVFSSIITYDLCINQRSWVERRMLALLPLALSSQSAAWFNYWMCGRKQHEMKTDCWWLLYLCSQGGNRFDSFLTNEKPSEPSFVCGDLCTLKHFNLRLWPLRIGFSWPKDQRLLDPNQQACVWPVW